MVNLVPSFLRKKEAQPPPKLSGFGQKAVYGLGALAFLAIIAPVTLFALQAITNLLLAGIGIIVFSALFMAIPAISQWWKIAVLKMLKASARRNPVETLEDELRSKREALINAQAVFVKIAGRRDSLRERLEDLKKAHKGKTDNQLERLAERLSTLTDRLETSLRNAAVACEEYAQFVSFQSERWEIAQESGELATMLREVGGQDVTSRFLANTAIDTIRTQLNISFADIGTLLQNEEVKQLTFEGGKPDLSAFTITSPVPEPVTARA